MADAHVEMRRHYQSGKVHAFLPDQAISLCGYTRTECTAPGHAGLVCRICERLMQERNLTPVPVPEAPLIEGTASNQGRSEEMHVEVVGGPWDGTRLILDVVREGPNQIRVLQQGFTWTQPVLRASEVEKARWRTPEIN